MTKSEILNMTKSDTTWSNRYYSTSLHMIHSRHGDGGIELLRFNKV